MQTYNFAQVIEVVWLLDSFLGKISMNSERMNLIEKSKILRFEDSDLN